MNHPPDEHVPLLPDPLREFVAAVFQRAGMPAEQADLLAGLLVTNDLRGVFSHGTRQVPSYVGHFREGRLTPAPEVRVTAETESYVTVDGGGGLGYFPAHRAAELLIPRAKARGIAMALTRNHGHIGAAGIYSRVPQAAGLFGYVTSGHQLHLQPGQTLLHAAGGSPHSFALPTGEEPPFVLDFGAVHDMYPHSPHVQEIIRLAPGTVFRSLGLGAVCQALGGFLAGVPADPERAQRQWPGADQGSFQIAVDLGVFMPPEQFRREMDDYIRAVRQLEPLAGFDEAMLPGEPEWRRERQYAAEGIPIAPGHAGALRLLAEEFDLPAPV
jgi:L-2-hydroxycarboxylate dehydrogenase (NAD+)